MTRLFDNGKSPRVFALPPGCNFIQELGDGLHQRLRGQPPEAIGRVRIYLNTRRAARALQSRLSEGVACLLPDIRVLTDLATDPLAPVDLPPPEPALSRKLLTARLVGALLEAQPVLGPRTAMFELTDSILKLLDEMDAEGVTAAALDTLDVDAFSEHWARSVSFLAILRDSGVVAASQGGEGRLRAVIDAFAAHWAEAPPDAPIIVAGSTGSRGSTAHFMRAVAGLPQGAVILPGMDRHIPAEIWDAVAEAPEHPQFGLSRFCQSLGLDPAVIPDWTDARSPAPERAHLLSLALRPAPVTDQWFSEGQALGEKLTVATACVTILEASHPQLEAAAIAYKLRGALADGKTAALVTPDRVLARRVGAYLNRWKITADDSAGRPLPLTPPGTLLRLLSDLAGQDLTPVRLLAILKHPLVGGKDGRHRQLLLTRRLELDMLRGGSPVIDWAELDGWARGDDVAKPVPDAVAWVIWLRQAFSTPDDKAAISLEVHLERHRDLAEVLSAGMDAASPGLLWEKDAGAAARAAMDELLVGSAHAGVLSMAEYRALLASHFKAIEVREEAYEPHSDLAIWGTLEARTQTADVIVLGGLNEAIWPPQITPDVWLNRAMRVALGLSAPERRTGLSAHDFQQAASAHEIVLSRAVRTEGAPTVPSRWLNRLNNLIGGLGENGKEALDAMRARGVLLADQADALDRLAEPALPAVRPAPIPPANVRPARLSVTGIETLIRDPYAIYARSVLGLRRLDVAGRLPDDKTRGTVIHAILEAFISDTRAGLPEDAEAVFHAVTERILARDVPWPSYQSLWRARLSGIAPWFLRQEQDRRRSGVPLATEVRGRAAFSAPHPDFTLTANADRIDLQHDGTLAIYDYKSGAPPSPGLVDHFAKQLLLEAVIAEAGGFAGIDPKPVSVLRYIGLGSGGKERSVDVSPDITAAVTSELFRLIASYHAADMPFPARTKVQYLTFEGDFDQLSRLGEWRDGDKYTTQVVG